MNTFTKRATVMTFAGLAVALIACKKDDPNAQSAANQQQYPNGQYPQGQQQYPQQQYPQQQYPQQQYPQQTTTPGATTPAAGGTLATPGPLALPCTSDSACLLHKCNVPAGKCAFPCQTDFDCNPGNRCNVSIGACHP